MSLYLQFKSGVHRNTGMIFKRTQTNRTMNTSYKVDTKGIQIFKSSDAYSPVNDSWDMEHPITFRYTKQTLENIEYVDVGEQTMQRSNISIVTNDNLDWSLYINSKVKLDDGEIYMLKRVVKSKDRYFDNTNLLGASNNFIYTLTLA